MQECPNLLFSTLLWNEERVTIGPCKRGGHYFEFSFPLSLGPFWRRVHMKCVESNLKVENNGACTGCLHKLKKNK